MSGSFCLPHPVEVTLQKLLCSYGCMYFLATLVLVCVDVIVMSSAYILVCVDVIVMSFA